MLDPSEASGRGVIMPGTDTPGTGGGSRAIGVSLNDFPVFDGVGCPESFIRQCARVAALGGIDDDQLSAIMAARCRGLALQVVESSTDSADVADLLKSAFAAQQRPEAAAMQLSVIKKGSMSVTEYALQVKTLVRKACPELFDQTGSAKKTCAPAYQAALYRHFLTGLAPEERLLLSRQGASSFDAAVRELTREEEFAQLSAADSGGAMQSLGVHWADSAVADGRPRARSASRELAGTLADVELGERRRCFQTRSPGPASPRRAWRDPSRVSSDAEREERRRRSQPRSPSPASYRRAWRDDPSDGGAGGRAARSVEESGGSRRSDPRRTGWRGRRQSRSPRRWSESEDEDEMPARSGSRTRRGSAAPDRDRQQVRCWSCRGYGHLKRQCPNGQQGRLARE